VQIKAYLRSYSFRSWALIFLAFGVTLVGVRVTVYAHTLRTAYSDIRLIIEAHAEELNDSIDLYGIDYAGNLVNELIQRADDEKLYIALNTSLGAVGNFPLIPDSLLHKAGWSEVLINAGRESGPVHLNVRSTVYPDGSVLLVGYDLSYIDSIKHDLPKILFENIELALMLAMSLSLVLVWLLNRHVRKFNRAFENLRRGNLGYRMSVQDETDQFDRLARNLNRTLDWLNTILTTSRDLSDSLAHDLRTPLSRHRLELRAISEDESLSPALKARLEASVDHLDVLAEMFNNILTISKAESQSGTELFESVDIKELLGKVLDFYAPMIEEKQVELVTKLPAAEVMAYGDRQLLGQAFLNLIDNAIKYTPPAGAIRAELSLGKSGVTLVIADTGSGVPPGMLDKVTERFFRADESRHLPGTGLGLSLVEAIAKLHSGNLVLENTFPGFKATLTIATDIK